MTNGLPGTPVSITVNPGPPEGGKDVTVTVNGGETIV